MKKVLKKGKVSANFTAQQFKFFSGLLKDAKSHSKAGAIKETKGIKQKKMESNLIKGTFISRALSS